MSKPFWAPGELAADQGIGYFQLVRIINKLKLKPVARAGNTRLFGQAARNKIAEELKQRGKNDAA
jgi:hypothetical protein